MFRCGLGLFVAFGVSGMCMRVCECVCMFVCFNVICLYLSQFFDSNGIGGRWLRLIEHVNVLLKPKCPAKSIAKKAYFVCLFLCVFFVSLGGLYREKVLSDISVFIHDVATGLNLDKTVNTFSTLSCNIDNKNELQCLVHMHPEILRTRSCYTAHGTVNHSFCGRLCE